MNKSADDQKALADRAMKEKLDKEHGASPNHPSPGRTADQGMHPIERDEPVSPGEKSQD